jgi:hypothetical protein
MSVKTPIMIEENKVVTPDSLDWIWEGSVIETT